MLIDISFTREADGRWCAWTVRNGHRIERRHRDQERAERDLVCAVRAALVSPPCA